MYEESDWSLQHEPALYVLALGGPELPDSARNDAGEYVDREYPWDGVGDEPSEGAPAWLAVLWQQAEEPCMAFALLNRRSKL